MVLSNSSDKGKIDLVVDSLLSYIIANHMRPGEKLPSEEELTHRLGVSRVSVREGLRGLKFLGLLKSTTSRGTEICEMDFGILTRCLGFQIAINGVVQNRVTLCCNSQKLVMPQQKRFPRERFQMDCGGLPPL